MDAVGLGVGGGDSRDSMEDMRVSMRVSRLPTSLVIMAASSSMVVGRGGDAVWIVSSPGMNVQESCEAGRETQYHYLLHSRCTGKSDDCLISCDLQTCCRNLSLHSEGTQA